MGQRARLWRVSNYCGTYLVFFKLERILELAVLMIPQRLSDFMGVRVDWALAVQTARALYGGLDSDVV